MYYFNKLSCYNFGIHINDTDDAVMCLWHVGQSGRRGNQMVSYLLHAINSGTLDTQSKHLMVWSDNNRGGQLKNRMLVCLYMMLISWDVFYVIEHKFLLSGHSFSSADRFEGWDLVRIDTTNHFVTRSRYAGSVYYFGRKSPHKAISSEKT